MVIKSINQFFGKNSRWIFGIFTVVIIISFMGFLTPGTFGGCGMGTAGEAGTVFGKSVTYSKLAEIRLYQSILTGFARDISVEEAFGMCCMEEAAGRRGISASDKEVAEFIIAMFSAEGKFNKEAYDNYLKTVKERYGITSSEFNNAVRLAIVVDKLQKDVAASVIVTDDEIESFYKVLYSKINEKRLHLKYSDYQDKVSVSDEEAAAFLKDNQKNYRIPARTKALLACFEYNDPALVAEADKMITEEAMKNYYEQNTTRFTVNSGKDSVITPYDKARESVRINLRDENIKKIALRKAQDFARDVYDAASEDVKNCGVIFKDYVSRNNIKNIAIPYFSAADTKLGTVESAALAQEIIESVSDVPVSNAVVANNGVYVGYAYDFEAERDAKLAEVKDRVVKDLRADKARKMAEAECDKIYTELAVLSKEELAKKIEADKRFAAVEPYMFMAQAKDFAESLIRMKTFMMEEGELSEKVSVLDGVVLTYVVQRALPDMKDFAEHKAALEMSYKQQKEYTAWNEFQAYLSSQCAMNQ